MTINSTHLPARPTISVIIPTLNEAKNLPLVLPYIPLDMVDEVIMVDGRSTDQTIHIAKRLLPSIKIIMETTPGKGAALRRGYAESTGDILVVLDADGSHDPREIPRFINALLEGADFVKGSRFAPTGGTTDMPRLRKLGNWGFTKLVNLLFSQSFTDLCYGYHAFWRFCLEYLNLNRVNGFEIDTAIYLQAIQSNLKVVDVPSFEGYRFYGCGKLKTFPDGWRVLRTIFKEWNTPASLVAQAPPIGFRNIRHQALQSGSTAIPITGWANAKESGSIKNEIAAERQPLTLEQFFQELASEGAPEDIDQLISDVLINVVEYFGASSGSLVIFHDDPDRSKFVEVFGRTTEFVPVQAMRDVLQEGIAGWVIQNQQPTMINSTISDSRWLSQAWEIEEQVSRSAMVVPFENQAKVISVLVITRPEDRQFTEEDLQRIKDFEIYV